MKISVIIRCIGVVSLFLTMSSCGNDSHTDQSTEMKLEKKVSKSDTLDRDTVWQTPVSPNYQEKINTVLDTNWTIDGELYQFQFYTQYLDAPYTYVDFVEKKGTIEATKYIGKNRSYQFTLRNSGNAVIARSRITKEDVDDFCDGLFLAMGGGYSWHFDGYNEAFESFVFTVNNINCDSDFGQQILVFIGKDMKIKHAIVNCGLGGGECDCDLEPSHDQRTYSLCTRIQKSNGSFVELQSEEENVAGSFQLNNEYSLVIYTYQGKPPYKNAKIIHRSGSRVKSFDFQGIAGEMGYAIPHFIIEDQNAFCLVDEERNLLIRIPLDNPTDLTETSLDDLPVAEPHMVDSSPITMVYGVTEIFQFINDHMDLYRVK